MGNMSGSYGSHYTLAQTITQNSQDITNNKTNVTVKLTLTFDGSSYYAYTNSSTSGTMTINGTQRSYSISSIVFSSGTKKTITLATWTGDISHNADGTKTLSVSGTWDTDTSRIGSGSCSTSKTLTTIPRKSTVSATSANIGSNSTITISRASSSFTHTLTYSFGSLSGTIATKTASTSVSWTLPDTFYAQIPNAKSGTGTITCTTYSGSTSIGTSTCSFTANTVESSSKPTVTATVTDVNSITTALTGNSSKLVLNASTARIVITSTLNKSAGSIKSVTVNGTNVGTSASITRDYTNVTTGTFTIVTTDSRGYSTTVTLSPSTVTYIPLTLNAQIYRTSPTTGEVSTSYNGNYFNGSFGSVSNTLTVTYQYKLSTDSSYTTGTATITPTISGNTYTRNATSLGSIFTYTNSYDFIITVTDKIKTVSYSITINQGQPIFYWEKDFFKINTDVEGQNWNIDTQGNADFGGDISSNGKVVLTENQKVLWEGASYMNASQTATLSENISDQNNGIVLIFSPYQNNAALNWGFNFYFIPKKFVGLTSGDGVNVPLSTGQFANMATKYLYIRNNSIAGNAANTSSGTDSGITYNNSFYVLRYVIGV